MIILLTGVKGKVKIEYIPFFSGGAVVQVVLSIQFRMEKHVTE